MDSDWSKPARVMERMILDYLAAGETLADAYNMALETYWQAEAAAVVAEAQKWANREVVK